MELVFATNNAHKLEEIRAAADSSYTIYGLKEKGIVEEIPETQDTLEGNAIQKAQYIHEKYGFYCFADDTGLEVKALNNQPGVFSARYAGPNCSFEDNVNKLLRELKGIGMRDAVFRTVIAYIDSKGLHTFEGNVEGIITENKHGSQGFGYDPVFKPISSEKTFAEMSMTEKNLISHRARALKKFVAFLNQQH